MDQYTEKAIAYMQAQNFFIEHCIKESMQVLGLSQFQTRKWLAQYHLLLKGPVFSFTPNKTY
jgi:hypothetical protein